MLKAQFVRTFTLAALSPDPDLAVAALMIARIEYPCLDAGPYLDRIDAIGREAKRRVEAGGQAAGDAPPRADPDDYARVMALNEYLFKELRFVGNDVHYEDPRNSFLNEVLDRRTGIPITLAMLYMEVARRAGLYVEGINFPGHFLLRGSSAESPPPRPATPRLHRRSRDWRSRPSFGRSDREAGIGGRDRLLAARTVEPKLNQRYPLV